MTTLNRKERRVLARELQTIAFSNRPRAARPTVGELIVEIDRRLAAPIGDAHLKRLDAAAQVADPTKVTAPMRRALLEVFGQPAVERAHLATPAAQRRGDISHPPPHVLLAAARVASDPAHAAQDDLDTIDNWVQQKGHPIVADMNDYVIEPRGEARDWTPGQQKAFLSAVNGQLQRLGGRVRASFVGVVAGRLILDGNTEPERSDFAWAIKRAYDDGVRETDGKPNKDHYEAIVGDIRHFRRGEDIRVQELAAVADHVISAGDQWSIDDERERRPQVELGLLKYADGTADTGFAPLDLPSIVSEDASNQEIEPQNVRAVAMIAAAYEIEQTGAFDVVDRMVELFMQGMMPVRDDSGGRALDRYYWHAEDRLDASARDAQYARVLGKGSIASSDAQPNSAFDAMVMRFVSNLVRYDGDLQVSNVVSLNRGERPGSSEQVRKAAQDLAANASLYGWGFSIFAARRLSRHVDLVFDVLSQETLQRSYGVTGPWQLVERVSAAEFGVTAAVVQHRTRAQAIKDILDLLAGYASALAKSGAVTRFLPGVRDLQAGQSSAVVSLEDYDRLVSAANSLLAVGGITEEDLAGYSRPVADGPRASIPTINGDGGIKSAGVDQLLQLVNQGQHPSGDQIKALLMSGMA